MASSPLTVRNTPFSYRRMQKAAPYRPGSGLSAIRNWQEAPAFDALGIYAGWADNDRVPAESANLAQGGVTGASSPERLMERVAGRLADTAVLAACDRFGLHPVGKVGLHFDSAPQADAPFFCTLGLEVLPEVDLPENLEDLIVEVEEPIVQPGELQAGIRRFLRSLGKLELVAERRRPGDLDVVNMDVICTHAGRILPGLSAKGFLLQLRPGQQDLEVARLVRTLHAGEAVRGTLRCPENYPETTPRGKELPLEVRLNSINREVLPSLDDALAKSLGRKNLRELKAELHAACMKRKLDASRKRAEQRLLHNLADAVDFPVPPGVVAVHRKRILLELRQDLIRRGYQDAELDRALDALADDCAREALRLAKIQTYLMALGCREKIVVFEREMERGLEELAAAARQDVAALKSSLEDSAAMPELLDRLLAEKALDLLYRKAHKRVVDINGQAVTRPQASPA